MVVEANRNSGTTDAAVKAAPSRQGGRCYGLGKGETDQYLDEELPLSREWDGNNLQLFESIPHLLEGRSAVPCSGEFRSAGGGISN